MNRLSLIIRQKIFIIIFIVLVVMGGVLIYWYVGRDDKTGKKNPDLCSVIVAKSDISAGTVITEDMIEYREIPDNIYSEDFIVLKEDIVGRKTNSEISRGEIISIAAIDELHLKEEGYLRFSSYIPRGLRATSIAVNYYGDNSLLNCGDRIDIISTFYDKASDSLISDTVLKNKEIILIEGKKNRELYMDDYEGTSNTEELSILDGVFNGDIDDQVKSNLIVITLYLRPEEVEDVFLSMEMGILNVSICPTVHLTGF